MSQPFLAGALSAWAIVYCSVGLIFVLANLLFGRDREYLLFGLFVLSLAVMNAGYALLLGPNAPDGLWANRIGLSGALLASQFQLLFVLRYSGRARRWNVWGGTVIVTGLLVWTWSVLWGETPRADADGLPILLLRLHPALRATFSAFVVFGLLYSFALMLDTYRRSKREALLLVFAITVITATVARDLSVIFSPHRAATELLSPYTLWIYVVAMATLFLLRFRGAEGRLAETASNLRARTEELKRSHAALEKVQSELVRKEQLAAVGELAASIAHEVRNPLAVIVNANAGLRRQTLSEQDRETLLSIIDEETERLNRLVAELLRFARPVTAKPSAVSLAELCEQVCKGGPPGYRVSMAPPENAGLDTVWVDPGLFRVVLDNLVANACQAMRAGGTVTIAVRADQFDDDRAAIAIDVTDNGHGMDLPVLQRALNPFFTTRPSGTGLGLPIVQRIVEAHGGDLRLDSRPGTGTTATLRIPRGRPRETTSYKIPVELTAESSSEEILGR